MDHKDRKHGGSLTKTEAHAVAGALEVADDYDCVRVVVGDGRYVQARYRDGGLLGTVVITQLTDELRAAVNDID